MEINDITSSMDFSKSAQEYNWLYRCRECSRAHPCWLEEGIRLNTIWEISSDGEGGN